MEHSTSSARARRVEPSWPTVIATTVRLWLERHHGGTRLVRRRLLALAAVLAVAVSAGVAGAVIGRGATPSAAVPRAENAVPRAAVSLRTAVATRDRAATWIARQVIPSAIVACDPAMCAALQASGIPAGSLLILGTTASDPLGSDIVVATPALRSHFAARLQSVYAPAVIASFGSGAGRIDVRAVAPDGAAAYDSALAADRRARMAAGSQLLRNRRIAVSADVRSALRAGEVDPRLLVMLAALAAEQPVRILALGDPSPGVVAPFRSAEIVPRHAGASAGARLRAMLSFLRAQRPPFLPVRATVGRASALSVEYAAPSPLGLLSGP